MKAPGPAHRDRYSSFHRGPCVKEGCTPSSDENPTPGALFRRGGKTHPHHRLQARHVCVVGPPPPGHPRCFAQLRIPVARKRLLVPPSSAAPSAGQQGENRCPPAPGGCGGPCERTGQTGPPPSCSSTGAECARPHYSNGGFSRVLLPWDCRPLRNLAAETQGWPAGALVSMRGFSGCSWGEDSPLIQTDLPERGEPRTAAGTYTNVASTSPRSPGCSPPRPLWLQAGGQQVGGQERDLTGARDQIDLSPAAAGNPQGTQSRIGQNFGPRSRAWRSVGRPWPSLWGVMAEPRGRLA